MEKHVALLRGINVGGKNKISMPALKAAFGRHGFSVVETYINSGNVFFECESNDQGSIKTDCKSVMASEFGLTIAVNIISVKDLLSAVLHAPDWWNADAESKHNAIFVISPVTVEEIFEQVGTIKPEYEKVGCYGDVIFWSAPIKTFSKTRWSKIVGTTAYNNITIRNANTVMKLARLVERSLEQ